MKGDEAKCREAGMNDYLSKPFRKDQLKDILEKYMPAQDVIFDIARLELLKAYKDDHGIDLRISLIDTYLQTTPMAIANLEKSSESDVDQFQKIAHTLKSSTAALGGVRLSAIFEYLENQKLSLEQRRELMQAVSSEFILLKDGLMNYQKSLG
jgi:CheY-like chemotaxis protein